MTYLLVSIFVISAITIVVSVVRERKRRKAEAWNTYMTGVAEKMRQHILNPPAPEPDPMEDEKLLAAVREQGFPLTINSALAGKMRIDPSPPFGNEISYGYEAVERVVVEPLGAFALNASVEQNELNTDFIARIDQQLGWLRSNVSQILSEVAPRVQSLIKEYGFNKEAPHTLNIPELWSQLNPNLLVLWPTEYRIILTDPTSDLHGLDLCIEFDSNARITSVYFDG